MRLHLKRFFAALLLTALLIPVFSGVEKAEAASVGKSKITSVKLGDNDKPVIKWKTVSNAKGYRLYRMADDAEKWNRVTTTKKTTFTDKKLPDSTDEVKYRVRAYTVNSKGEKVFGKYSTVKTIKIVNTSDDETVNDRTDGGKPGNEDKDAGESEDSPYPSDEVVRATILALKKDYPEGMRWTNANSYVWGKDVAQSLGYSKYTGLGCQGFAMIASDAVYGNSPAYKYTDKARIRVGDILRIKDDTHSVVVLSIDGKKITVAEGNYNSSIHWGSELDLDKCGFVYGLTRVPLK